MKCAIAALLLQACLASAAVAQALSSVVLARDVLGELDGARFDLSDPSGLMATRWRSVDAGNGRDGLIGLTVPLGDGAVSAGYMPARAPWRSEARGAKMAFGYTRQLSKDTTFYVQGSRLRNGVTVRYQTTLPGKPRQLFSIGIRRQF